MDLESHLRTLLSIQVKQWQLSQKHAEPQVTEEASVPAVLGLAACLKENIFGCSNEAEPDGTESWVAAKAFSSESGVEEGELAEEEEDGLSGSSLPEEGELSDSSLPEEGELSDSSLLEEDEQSFLENRQSLLGDELATKPEAQDGEKSQLSALYSKYHQLKAQMQANHVLLSDAWVQYEAFRDKMNTMLEIIDKCHSIQEQFTESMQDLRLEISETKRVRREQTWAKRRGSTQEESVLPFHSDSLANPRKHARADLPDWCFVAQQLNNFVRALDPTPPPKHIRFEEPMEVMEVTETVSQAWLLDTDYESPLGPFGEFCFSDAYRERFPHIYSLTYARMVDPDVPFCTVELSEGACDLGSLCTLQHISGLDVGQLHVEFLRSLITCIVAGSRRRGLSANWVKGLLTEAVQKSTDPEDCFALLATLWGQTCS